MPVTQRYWLDSIFDQFWAIIAKNMVKFCSFFPQFPAAHFPREFSRKFISRSRGKCGNPASLIQKLLKQKEKLDQELLKVEEDNRYDMDAIALRDSDDELLGELANIQEEIDKIKERDRMDKPEEHGETK